MNEHWAPIFGFESLYEVSDMGRVRSLSRVVRCNKNSKRLSKGRVLSLSKGTGGYPQVMICDRDRTMIIKVHRAVAEAFVPGTGAVVRHLDGNPRNNCADNLEWGSYADNEADKRRHGRTPMGERHPNAKLTIRLVREIRRLRSEGLSQSAIACALDIKRGVVGKVVRGEGWSHVA